MGYEHSPKWFNISIFNLSLLGLVYYTILKKSNILIYFAFSLGPHIGEYRRGVNTIKNINNNIEDYKLLTRIYKHSTPQFIERIQTFVNNNKLKNYETYFKNKENISKLGDNIALALFISINTDQLVNIIFN